MAHVTIEWTANLAGSFDLRALMQSIAQHMREQAEGVFPVGGIRVRGYRIDDYVIADDTGPDDAFININVKMGVGRGADFRQRYFDALFLHVTACLGDLPDRRPMALSLYVEEVDGWKANGIHKRLRNPN